ncbi:MAG: glycosyltransferase family 39 protein, partial [Candidatus Omnitrophica bacterium]|nr:glycosyltransferase family 39 protein [Candidatus Omnitrophota bacterium]
MRALFRSPTGLGALLFGLVLLAYFPSIFCGFIWDDDVGIINNENLRTLDGLGRIWSDPSKTPQGHYWPMVYTTYWLEYRLWGLNPAGYHVANILLQAINSLFLWRLLLRLEVPGAWFVAALFGVHPIQVESVAWIIERKNLLCGVFSLSTVLLFMTSLAKKSWTAYIGAIVLFVFAMLSKSSAFSLPFVLIILVGWRYPREFLKRLCWTLPFLAIGSVIAWWDVSLVQKKEVIEHGLSLFDRLVISGKAFWFYPIKLLIPANFVAVYPKWEVESFSTIDLVWPISVTLVGILLLALAWKGRPGALAAYALYAVLLAPTVGFVDFGFMALSFVADRFAYLACIPLFALVVGGMRMVIQRSGNRGFWQIVIGGVLGVLVLLSAIQCRVYKNQETLVRH